MLKIKEAIIPEVSSVDSSTQVTSCIGFTMENFSVRYFAQNLATTFPEARKE